jgi:hypothetical protein
VERLGVNAYARWRGCSAPSVVKAIKAGRLVKSVEHDANGHPSIDARAADLEWQRNTDPGRRPIEALAAPTGETSVDLVGLLESSWGPLVDASATFEARLSKVFRAALAAHPDDSGAQWQAAYEAWRGVSEALIAHNATLRRLLDLLAPMANRTNQGRKSSAQ